MPQNLCLIHANCQGDALRPLLENTPGFARYFHIRQYTNYKRQRITGDDIGDCRLFLYQKLAPKWGEISTEYILPRLPATCQRLEIPNFFFKGYWPLWTNSAKTIEFADSLLESLLDKGLELEDVMNIYLRADSNLLGDVAQVAEESLVQEEQKEACCPVKYAFLLRERWQQEQLFITVNHPGNVLLFHLADNILRFLGLGGLPAETQRHYVHPHKDFWLPIHPALGYLLHLPFATRLRRYPVFSTCLTHQEYISCYLACRRHGTPDLLSLLKNLSPDGSSRSRWTGGAYECASY